MVFGIPLSIAIMYILAASILSYLFGGTRLLSLHYSHPWSRTTCCALMLMRAIPGSVWLFSHLHGRDSANAWWRHPNRWISWIASIVEQSPFEGYRTDVWCGHVLMVAYQAIIYTWTLMIANAWSYRGFDILFVFPVTNIADIRVYSLLGWGHAAPFRPPLFQETNSSYDITFFRRFHICNQKLCVLLKVFEKIDFEIVQEFESKWLKFAGIVTDMTGYCLFVEERVQSSNT